MPAPVGAFAKAEPGELGWDAATSLGFNVAPLVPIWNKNVQPWTQSAMVRTVPYNSGPTNIRANSPASNGGFEIVPASNSLGGLSENRIGVSRYVEQAARPSGPIDYTQADFFSFGKTEEGITGFQLVLVLGVVTALAFGFGLTRGIK